MYNVYTDVKTEHMRRILACLFLLAAYIGGRLSCENHVCLSWNIKQNTLLLTCKVDNLRFAVTFFDPLNAESAFCTPPSHCEPVSKHVSIQKESERAVILKVNRTTGLNGWWTCKYGESIGNASVEVTINSVSVDHNKTGTNKYCTLLMVSCAMFGLASGYIFIQLILFIVIILRTNEFDLPTKMDDKIDSWTHCCGRCSVIGKKKVISFVLIVCLVLIAVLMGVLNSKLCEDYVGFTTLGLCAILVGMICCLLLVSTKLKANTGPNRTTYPPNHRTESGEDFRRPLNPDQSESAV